MTENNTEKGSKEELFLEYLFNEAKGNIREAMRMAGYPSNHPTTSLLKKLNDEILQLTREYIASHSPQAAITLVHTLTNPSEPGTNNVLKAAQEILDRAGVVKEEKIAVTGGGVAILPSKQTQTEEEETN